MDKTNRTDALKAWEDLTIADNFIFQKVMRKKRLCKRLIENILNIKIRKITFPETEKDIHVEVLCHLAFMSLYGPKSTSTSSYPYSLPTAANISLTDVISIFFTFRVSYTLDTTTYEYQYIILSTDVFEQRGKPDTESRGRGTIPGKESGTMPREIFREKI